MRLTNSVLLLFIVVTQIIIWGSVCNVRINVSGSMPIGIYRLYPGQLPTRGEWVSVCLPNPVATVGWQRGYLQQGHCPNGIEPVVKAAIATPADKIIVTPQAVFVAGKRYRAPVQQRDHNALALTGYVQQATLLQGGYWLYGVNDPEKSWDSRYFGPVSEASIQGVVKPIWLWSHAETPADATHESASLSDSACVSPPTISYRGNEKSPKLLKENENHPPASATPVDLFEASLKFPDHAHTTKPVYVVSNR